MIEQETVLILGAGASEHFGYPLGYKLKKEILDGLGQPGHTIYQSMAAIGFASERIAELHDALLYSGKESIDAFLEHRKDLVDIGKAAIATCLVRYEDLRTLFEAASDWYSYLYARMNVDFDRFGRNKVAIVTFNYDRSLETFLFTALKNSFRKDDPQVALALRPIQIVHVHGSLGPLPWQAHDGTEYSAAATPTRLSQASQSIRIIHEGDPRSSEFTIARELIDNAQRVVFLGFGYDSVNLSRLALRKDVSKYWGSTYGMTPREMDELRSRFSPVGIELGMQTQKALEYLRYSTNL